MPFPDPTSSLPLKLGVEKSPFEISAKRFEIDHMCHKGANRNPWAGFQMKPSMIPTYPKRHRYKYFDDGENNDLD